MISQKNKNNDKKDPSTKKMLVIIGLTLLFMLVYFTAVNLPEGLNYISYAVTGIYMAALAVLAVVYICYNYAFTRKGVTEDMLPDTWSQEKKQDYIRKGKEHKEKSQWMLMVIFPLVVTFIADVLYLFVWTGWLENFFM